MTALGSGRSNNALQPTSAVGRPLRGLPLWRSRLNAKPFDLNFPRFRGHFR